MKYMQDFQGQLPFGLLGARLKHFRETRQESVAEVSGAVEIDADVLERIERGEECPSEDILALLINHFDLHEREAVQLYEWAGLAHGDALRSDTLQDLASRATLVLVALDARAAYADGASVTANQSGVILSFMQSGPHGQQLPIARVGMSYEQATQVVSALQRAILRKQYLPKNNLLPPGDTPQS